MHQFGDVVRVPFPFEEDGFSKKRYGFVLEQQGGAVLVAYMTTNPSESVRLGVLQGESKVTNLVPHKVALIQNDLVTGQKQRVEFAHVLRPIIVAARAGCYGDASGRIAEEAIRQVGYAVKRAEKKAAKAGKR